jgi:hypothetical protein
MRPEFMTPVEIDTLMVLAGHASRKGGVSIIGYDPYHLPNAEELAWAHATIRARDEELASVKFVLAARDKEIAALKLALRALPGGMSVVSLAGWGRAGLRLSRRAAQRALRSVHGLGARLRPTRRR